MKKILSIALVLMLLVSIAAVAVASSTQTGLVWKDGFGFHCNAGKGNGKVTTGFEKATIGLTREGASTTWNLDININNVCPSCQRIDWVTFSNKNGVINGKNIQVNHSDNPVYRANANASLVLVDTVLDCEGKLISQDSATADSKSGVFATNNSAIFNFDIPPGYNIIEGANPVVISFEAKAGQNLSGKVVAERVTVLPCDCEEEEEEDDWDFFGGNGVCPPCQSGNGNNHSNCFANHSNPKQQVDCACWCRLG